MNDLERSSADLNAALGHITYEFWMMFEGAAGAAATSDEPANVALRNAWLEVYVLHARVLVYFFSHPEPQRESDICLLNFGDVDWTISEVDRQWLKTKLSVPANKRMAHLTWERIVPLAEGWGFDVAQRLADVGESWRLAVEESRQDLDWSSFFQPKRR